MQKSHKVAGVNTYELYVADATGKILAGLNDKSRFSGARFRRNLQVCLERITSGNAVALAELTHTSKTTLSGWLNGEALPRLDVLLRYAYYLGISVRDLVMSCRLHEVDWTVIEQRFSLRGRDTKCYRNSETLLCLMKEALNDDDCPSVPELAKRLGYKRHERLRQVSPELCRRLTQRYRAGRRTHWSRLPGAKRIAEPDRIRTQLELSMKQDHPISVRRIATQLGYAGGNGGFIHRSFPELCESIAKKLQEWKDRRMGELRFAVNAAILEVPPPTLHALSQRLGFQTSTTLRYWVPDLADRLLKRRAEHAVTEKADLEALLRCVLQENPTPSLNSVARRIGRSTSFLKETYPDISGAFTAGYLQHRQIRQMMKTQKCNLATK